MPHHDLNAFTWMGEPLSNPPDWVNGVEYEEVTPLELTSWLVDKLRQSTQRDVARLLDETHIVRRLFSPIEVQKGWSYVDAEWDIDKPTHAFGIAMYIFCKNKAGEKCNTCKHSASIGPAEECVVDEGGRAQKACTNCYYKGRGGTCSRRVEAEAQVFAKKRKLEPEERLPGLQYTLAEVPEDELNDWVDMATKELRMRRLMRQFPGLSRSILEKYSPMDGDWDPGVVDEEQGLQSTNLEAPARRRRRQRG
ncbi:hypothetical protein KVR01_011717 [Diaporthe batatas]|uniref:uncharacterized protein n=1 Tax=Diaporthe batatas TaxID=748121 RepID=UPI001D04365E|nr:uncharacterized protein KVR01_011717 [Diaporthe batatas]KAG8158595.1 hypothetical protein KVR01_011717 [Diaporthe batatas]